jgi:DNA replication and repair protein RecF
MSQLHRTAASASPCSATTPRWVERLTLTNFRSHAALSLDLGPEPVVLTGPNGAGKTNLLEAVSLLAPGQGLRRAPFPELARLGGDGGWAVAARLQTATGLLEIGTGLTPNRGPREDERVSGRTVRIDRQAVSGSGALADHVEMVWLLPAMDGLFTGPAGDRRRFLDRLILCFDPAYRTRLGHFERAMRQRNKLLEMPHSPAAQLAAQLDGLEMHMAETGAAIAAARLAIVDNLARVIELRRLADPGSPFPWSTLAIEGALESELAGRPAVEVEDVYRARLRSGRDRDRAAGRTLDGPHRSDLIVTHGPKAMPARLCSTGEQKALLVGLVLAHAELIRQSGSGAAPILLLDEISAHLDVVRRAALFQEIVRLGAQAWMTGTDAGVFAPLQGAARFFSFEGGAVRRT